MSVESVSFSVRCHRDPEGHASRLRVTVVDGGNEVAIGEGSFIVRITQDSAGALTRCTIRHAATGREVYVQGGSDLTTFVQECLLASIGLKSA